jgi:hypothetical protein
LKKIIKNTNRILSRINHDFKNYHLFSLINPLSKNFGFKKSQQLKISNKIIDRVSKYALYLNKNRPLKKKNDLWNVIEQEVNHKYFFDSICEPKKYNNKLKKILTDLGKTNLLSGYGPNRKSYEELKSQKYKKDEKYFFFDYLISISEYYEYIKVFNPEQGGWMIEEMDYDNLVNRIFKKRNILVFKTPNYYYGYKCNKDFIFLKDLKGLYAAEQLKKIYKNNNLSEIIEIGAGIGYTCHYLQQLIKTKYTIYDLPFSSIMQAIYLMISIGEKNVHLDNEKLLKDKPSSKKIFIKPYWKIFDQEIKKNVLWFNEDSIPEIDIGLSKKYIKKILKSKKSYFLSINQEARNDYGKGINQHTVGDLLKRKSIYRSRDFLRPGYIEELFKIN